MANGKPEVSQAILYFYNSQTGEYLPINDTNGTGVSKFIPKVELYWYEENTNSYKPLVTDGTLPVDGGDIILEGYTKKDYVDDKVLLLNNRIDGYNIEITNIKNTYSLKTEVQTVVNSITTLDGKVGNVSALLTNAKNNLVSAINEVKSAIGTGGGEVDLSDYVMRSEFTGELALYMTKSEGLLKTEFNTKIGNLSNLTTTDKTSLVNAINEIKLTGGGSGGEVDLSGYATKVELNEKVDKVLDKQLSTEDYTSYEKSLVSTIEDKVDKVSGKQLSTEDYTVEDKDKLMGVENGANNYSLPIAKSNVLGGVKVSSSSGIELSPDGTISASVLKGSVDNHISDSTSHVSSSDRSKINSIGNVSSLATTNKTDLVSAMNEVFTDVSNGKNSLASAITAKGQTISGTSTFAQMVTAINNITTGIDTSDATVVSSDILSGKTAYNSTGKITGNMTNRGAVSQSLSANGTYTIPSGYHNGSGKVTQSLTNKTAQTYTPSIYNQTISSGQYLTGTQTILGDSNLISDNIKSGVVIFGHLGSFRGNVQVKSGRTLAFSFSITVTGLGFRPKVIITQNEGADKGKGFSLYVDNWQDYQTDSYAKGGGLETALTGDSYYLNNSTTITSDGFTTGVSSNGSNVTWVAFG